MLDRLTRQQPQQQLQLLVGDGAALRRMSTPKCSYSSARWPDAERVGDPAVADDVQHAHVLGQPDRIPERQHAQRPA